MFGNINPTFLKVQQVANEMALLLADAEQNFGENRCESFSERFGLEFKAAAFESSFSYHGHTHYLVIRLDESVVDGRNCANGGPRYDPRVAYIGLDRSSGRLVVFLSRRNPYPKFLPDHENDIAVLFPTGDVRVRDLAWAAREALGFFLWEE